MAGVSGYSRSKMDQEEIEDELFYTQIVGHLQLTLNVLQSSTLYRSFLEVLLRKETLYLVFSVVAVILSLVRYDREGRVLGWFRGITSCALVNSFYIHTASDTPELEWSKVTETSVIYSMQGRRAGNEDRAVSQTVRTPGGGDVHIYAVLDGHGGEFAANYAKEHLLKSLEKMILQLKLITSGLETSRKVLEYEKEFGPVPECVKTFLKLSEPEYREIVPKPKTEQSAEDDAVAETPPEEQETPPAEKTVSRDQVVLSNRQKSLEELPILKSAPSAPPTVPKTPIAAPRRSVKVVRKSLKLKGKTSKPVSTAVTPELTDYIGISGEILYSKLIKDEILKCDAGLLKAAKNVNAIGGTTLVLGILDSATLWVGNVGDSRGVCCSDTGQVIPLSFDHKPCQLKERRRIQDAGGFVALNGVWRVQGVLATSRALGDFPLKDKKVIVADPDVLSFNVRQHKIEFAVLASDGLWDTHTNEEVVEILRKSSRDPSAVRRLAQESYDKGSTDNITILLININKIVT